MPKEFFETFNRRVKRQLLARLQKENADAICITQEISAAAISFISIFFDSKKAGKKSARKARRAKQNRTVAAPPVDTNGDNNDDDTDASRASEVSETTPAPDDNNSLPAIKQSVRTVAQRIEAVVQEEVDLNEMVERLRDEMVALQALLTTLNTLRGEQGGETVR
ncbi:MAG: hypothetical protein CVU61_14515 [Deltaproteobacteria bacterium HGW-Deltaproteobacteria-19]|nr:MAG: hypothetical protein CVU61_14515 [Deltaproteobacteria bacterium HGW-Deltaproteobacteria-19]